MLILDEPTNHLDLESREALEAALRAFPGSLLLVSHDRALLDAVGTRTVALEDQTLHSYVGGWPEYLRVREERAKAPAPPKARAKADAASGKASGHRPTATKKRNPPKAKPGKGAAGLEAQIEAAEAALRAIEDELADPAAWATPEATRPLTAPPRGGQARGGRALRALGGGGRLIRRLGPGSSRRAHYTEIQMPQLLEASALRVALIDDDSGLITVLDRRFAALRWERQVLGYAAVPEQLAALRLHALVVNPALTGLDYIEWIADRLPGLALLVCSRPAPVADRVRALRGGADDWITKPCHPEELVARIEAVLRRRRAGELPDRRRDDRRRRAGDPPRPLRRLRRRQPRRRCRARSTSCSHQLAGAGGRVLEREDIYQRVWGYTMARGDRSVDVFVRKLRQKLEAVSPEWRYVHTHFGVGYRFAAEPRTGTVPDARAAPREVAAPAPARARRGAADAVRCQRRTLSAYEPSTRTSATSRSSSCSRRWWRSCPAAAPAPTSCSGAVAGLPGRDVVGGLDHVPRAPRRRCTRSATAGARCCTAALPCWRVTLTATRSCGPPAPARWRGWSWSARRLRRASP